MLQVDVIVPMPFWSLQPGLVLSWCHCSGSTVGSRSAKGACCLEQVPCQVDRSGGAAHGEYSLAGTTPSARESNRGYRRSEYG